MNSDVFASPLLVERRSRGFKLQESLREANDSAFKMGVEKDTSTSADRGLWLVNDFIRFKHIRRSHMYCNTQRMQKN